VVLSDTFPDFLDNAFGADLIDFSSFNSHEPTISVVLIYSSAKWKVGGAQSLGPERVVLIPQWMLVLFASRPESAPKLVRYYLPQMPNKSKFLSRSAYFKYEE
jgi:hypothetical protein